MHLFIVDHANQFKKRRVRAYMKYTNLNVVYIYSALY